jgi:cysteine desulfurase/selenocysteine lyase
VKREDFPILSQRIHGRPLVYLDNAATSQKPKAVLDEMHKFYSEDYSNIHRGVHTLSQRATAAYEASRDTVAKHLGATDRREVIFVRGATEGLNLAAHAFGPTRLKEGDEIVLTQMEHHSNIVPWQMLRERTGARIRVVPVTDAGEIRLEDFQAAITPRTRIVSVVHVSNTLGTVNPVAEMARIARSKGAVFVVDGAQAVPHLAVDVRAIGCDFYVFSGHKTYAPSGVGVLWGRRELLEATPPYQGGGDMIRSVTFEKTTYNDLPHRFEAGTPNIGGAIGLATAIRYMDALGMEAITRHEAELLAYATGALRAIPGIRILGEAREKAGVISFLVEGVHAHDVGTVLDQEGIAVRAGHHCTQPLMDRFGVPATARASFALYNTKEDVDLLAEGVKKVLRIFA